MMKYIRSLFRSIFIKKYLLVSFFCILAVLPLFIALIQIFLGNIPFWYDPARDMLAAWDNLSDPTLIGPTSGIPGIFYGPYWIWLLSIGLLFSKDPRMVVFVVGVIPYFIIFPFVLYKFSKVFRIDGILIIWLLFIFSFGIKYATMLWNPHLAPLLFLILMYLLVFHDGKTEKKNFITSIAIGVILGLLINFHISFGLGVLIGVVILNIVSIGWEWRISKNMLKRMFVHITFKASLISTGLVIVFLPSIFFELRHGFNQSQVLLHTLLKFGDVVVVKGLTQTQIIEFFFSRLSGIFHINSLFGILLFLCMTIGTWTTIKSGKISTLERKLVFSLIAISGGILITYMTAKNPVWEYHFIGTEIIFLFFIGFILNKYRVVKILVSIWTILIVLNFTVSFLRDLSNDPYSIPNLITKEYIVNKIAKDAKNNSYTVFNNSPSIYMYEYSYIFRWKYNKTVPYDPGLIAKDSSIVYLILSPTNDKSGFTNYYTPSELYKTANILRVADGTEIVKRIKK